MRIFLTGANGFIGSAVALALTAAGHRVRGLVRNSAKAKMVAVHGIDAVVGSLDDTAVLQAEARAADAVINAASKHVLLFRVAVQSASPRQIYGRMARPWRDRRRRCSRLNE